MSGMSTPNSTSVSTDPTEKLLQGRYRITRCLGSGGMGDVYLAEDLRLGRLVAVKSLKKEFCKMEEVRKRIERECVMHAQLGAHPNVITLYDRIDDDGQIHLIIEYVDGTTLKEVIEQARLGSLFLTWRESVNIACQILEALSKIHAQGIVHRDVKPANIMLIQLDTGAYVAKLMDFGIARLMNPVDGATMLTRQGGSGPGTPIYMAPEQIAGTQFGPLSPATDVYAAGVVLYQMLAKHPPYQGTITDIFHGHINAPPPPIDGANDATFPPQLTDIVHKALAKQPEDRFASALEFRRALKRLTKGQGAVTTLAVAQTVMASESKPSTNGAVPLTPVIAEPSTNGLLQRRNKSARNANRTVAAIVIVLVAVAAVVIGNFFFFRSLSKPAAPVVQSPQAVTEGTPAVSQQQTLPEQQVEPAPTPGPPVSATPEKPVPVVLEEKPKPVSAEEKPKPAAEKPKKLTTEEGIADTPKGQPVTVPKQTVPPAQTQPKEEPRRTPVPQQTPLPPDVSAPGANALPFSERARQFGTQTGQTPPDGDVFRDVQIIKRPATKVN